MSNDLSAEAHPPKPSGWKQFQQGSMPEAAWINDQKQLAALEPARRKGWLKRLCSKNKHVRQDAQRNFSSLSPADQRLLTAQAVQSAQSQRSMFLSLAWLLNFCMVIAFSVAYGSGGFGVSVVLAGVVAWFASASIRDSHYMETAQNLLDQMQDAQMVPFLLTRLYRNELHRRPSHRLFVGRNLRNALARLLPTVQEHDVAEWTGNHWHYILEYLRNPYEDLELTLLALDFVARLGTAQALYAVEELTKKKVNLAHATAVGAAREALHANQFVLEEAIQTHLPALQETLARQRQAQILLRPSGEIPSTAPDILLRPASATVNETPAEQLLRPGNAE